MRFPPLLVTGFHPAAGAHRKPARFSLPGKVVAAGELEHGATTHIFQEASYYESIQLCLKNFGTDVKVKQVIKTERKGDGEKSGAASVEFRFCCERPGPGFRPIRFESDDLLLAARKNDSLAI